MTALFVAGTDTDAGKTYVSCALLRAATAQGLRSLGLKPVAAGCTETAEGWRNDDALALQAAASVSAPYDVINPIALPLACAPHIAAEAAGRKLVLDRLAGFVRGALNGYPADVTLIEGAGGWRVPLNDRELLSGLPTVLNVPVILVVGLRLGCLNAALLTAEAMIRDGRTLVGWIATEPQPMPWADENVATLQRLMPVPLLSRFPHDPTHGEPTQQAATRGVLALSSCIPALKR